MLRMIVGQKSALGLAPTPFLAQSERAASLRLAWERGLVATVQTIGRADRSTARPVSPDAHAEALYERLYDRVYGYCLYQLGSREEAEDAAQVTFVQALRGLRRGVVPRFDAGWVFAIAKNVCIERYQSRGRRRDREVLLDPSVLESASVAGEPHNEDVARLRDALTHLPEPQREAVLLREWRGLSYREIAAEMGLSHSAVETLIFRARRSLAHQLTEEPDTKRARLAHGLALGPAAAGLKAAVGGSAAKIAAVAAGLVAVALAGGVLAGAGEWTDTPRRPAVVAPVDAPPTVEPSFLRPAAIPHPAPEAEPPATRAPARVRQSGAPKSEEKTGGSSQSGPLDPVLGATGDTLDPVLEQAGDTLDPVLQPVQPVVDQVESTLEPVLEAAPQLPEVALPELPALPALH
jgi:RNA polymerase sigma-70 factor (ECF subfamily)